MAKLGDVATYINGFAFKPSDWSDTGVPIIRIQDLTGNTYQANRYDGVYDKKYEVVDGDVLISWSASLGVYIWRSETAVLNQHIFKVVFDKVNIDKDFFVYQVEAILEKAVSEAHGATMKHLTKPMFDALPFFLPDIDEQKHIATVLNAITAVISLRKQQLQKLDELVKARFVEMFGDPMTDNSDWPISSLGDQFIITSGGTPPTNEPRYWEQGNISWIGSNMCQDAAIYENDGKYISEEGLIHSSAKLLEPGTVLVALVGATIGKTALLQFPTTTNQNVAGIDINGNKNYTSEFIFYFMQLMHGKFTEIGNGKFKMANLSFIRQLPMICPPLEEQQKFTIFVKQSSRMKLTVQQGLDKLEVLKKSLMQKYFEQRRNAK